MTTNYYTILGLPQNATTRQIRQRFLELARERHPDRFQGDEKAAAEIEFQDVTLAFNVLSDPERRREHDLSLLGPAPQADNKGDAARVYVQRGIKAYRQNNLPEAADNFDRATQEDPSAARAWHYLALSGRSLTRWRTRALAAAIRSCELEPMNVDYLKLAGELCAREGDETRAEQYLRNALTWGGDDPKIQAAIDELGGSGKKGKTGLFG